MHGLLLAGLLTLPLSAAPSRDMGFDRFVFAAIWQPGVCLSADPVAAEACRAGRRAEPGWTLHGLWADLPESLRREGLEPAAWYRYGCYWFRPGHAVPQSMCDDPELDLEPGLQRELDAEMPGRLGCLDRHEYFKHAQCYGFERNAFFRRALALLRKLNRSRFTAEVAARSGQSVPRQDLERSFARGFGLKSAEALELRCSARPGARTSDVLTQAWITLRRDRADDFPDPGAFLAGRRGNCAERVLVAPGTPQK